MRFRTVRSWARVARLVGVATFACGVTFACGGVEPAARIDTIDTRPPGAGRASDGGMTCGYLTSACRTECVVLSSDPSNCGVCGVECPSGAGCYDGVCASECTAGRDICAGACVDKQTNTSHCGGCGIRCAAGNPCVDGTCRTGATPSDGGGGTVTDGGVPTGAVVRLNYNVVDAEYSRQLNRIVLVSAAPNVLHIYDPAANTEETVALPTVPSSVSVGPTGERAAIGHNGFVSIVDLSAKTVVQTTPITTDVLDVVLAGNGYAYAFPRLDQWEDIRSLNLTTLAETSTGATIYAGTLGRLHPSGNSLYAANNGLSPSDIEKFNIQSGPATTLYDSPYHGTHPMCGDLWFSEDGSRIYTKCGNVFHATTDRTTDMTYLGKLAGVERIAAVADSLTVSKIAVIPDTSPRSFGTPPAREVRFYEPAFLNLESTRPLPAIAGFGGNPFLANGRWAFYRSDGSKLYVVLEIDGHADAGITNRFAVASY